MFQEKFQNLVELDPILPDHQLLLHLHRPSGGGVWFLHHTWNTLHESHISFSSLNPMAHVWDVCLHYCRPPVWIMPWHLPCASTNTHDSSSQQTSLRIYPAVCAASVAVATKPSVIPSFRHIHGFRTRLLGKRCNLGSFCTHIYW